MTTLTEIQQKVERSEEAQILEMLKRVTTWPVNLQAPLEMENRINAYNYIDEIQAHHSGAVDRARIFLFNLAEHAAARGAF